MEIDDRITITTPEGVTVDLVVAGIGSRFVARLLDSLIQGALIIALFVITGVLFASDGGGFAMAFASITAFAVMFLYDPILEQAGDGRTPGKRAAGIRVVDRMGRPVGLVASVVRNVVRLVDFLPFLYGVGLVAMLATEHAQRLGDLAAGTFVVRTKHTAAHELVTGHDPGRPTVHPSEVEHWDVSAVTLEELIVVRAFLARRIALPPDARWGLAVELATKVAAKTSGIPSQAHPEYVLEGVVVAKEMRR